MNKVEALVSLYHQSYVTWNLVFSRFLSTFQKYTKKKDSFFLLCDFKNLFRPSFILKSSEYLFHSELHLFEESYHRSDIQFFIQGVSKISLQCLRNYRRTHEQHTICAKNLINPPFSSRRGLYLGHLDLQILWENDLSTRFLAHKTIVPLLSSLKHCKLTFETLCICFLFEYPIFNMFYQKSHFSRYYSLYSFPFQCKIEYLIGKFLYTIIPLTAESLSFSL